MWTNMGAVPHKQRSSKCLLRRLKLAIEAAAFSGFLTHILPSPAEATPEMGLLRPFSKKSYKYPLPII